MYITGGKQGSQNNEEGLYLEIIKIILKVQCYILKAEVRL